MSTRSTTQPPGFSLVELVVTLSIVGVIVGFVSDRSDAVRGRAEARARKVAELADALADACERYHADTGRSAREYMGYEGATYHRLHLDPGAAGWAGPYLEAPLRREHNPVGARLHLYDRIVTGHCNRNGLDLDGDGRTDVPPDGAGNLLVLWGIGEELAALVDAELDQGLPGAWQDSGRVEWRDDRLTVAVRH